MTPGFSNMFRKPIDLPICPYCSGSGKIDGSDCEDCLGEGVRHRDDFWTGWWPIILIALAVGAFALTWAYAVLPGASVEAMMIEDYLGRTK